MSIKKKTPCYAIFHGDGGYPGQRTRARKLFRVGGQYRVIGGTMGQTYTALELEGVPGIWNSALFHYDETLAPVDFPYLRGVGDGEKQDKEQ